MWKLSRTLISAGWRYKSSGNGQTSGVKDTSANEATDQWAVGGAVNLTSAGRISNSGSGISIAAASASTGLAVISGITSANSYSVGDYLTITGSTSQGGATISGTSVIGTNNGSYRITAQTGTTVTVYAPGMVAETGNSALAVVEQFGGASAQITSFSTVTTSGGNGQSTLMTVTGLSGLSSADVGRVITIINASSGANNGTFLIVTVLSSSSCLIYNPNAVASDAQNGVGIQWVEVDPNAMLYPAYFAGSSGVGAWINLQGPTILKIPIGTNLPTGSFVRGENVIQTGTGAQGEMLGIVTDSSGGTGYLVIAPRTVGTGASAGSIALYGWNISGTDTITGGWSGATVTSTSGPPVAYVSEMIIWKGSATTGHIYHQRVDQNAAGESNTTSTTGRFSTMSTLSYATSLIPPGGATGGSPVTGGFASAWTGTYVVIGTGGSGAGGTSAALWPGTQTPTNPGKAHLIAANCVEQQGVSADGTWLYLQSCNSAGYQCLSYLRMDNQEDGDLDPYVHQLHGLSAISSTASRTADVGNTNVGSQTDNMNAVNAWFNNTGYHGFKGFRRRGLSSETFNYFSVALLYDYANASWLTENSNSGNPDQIGSNIATTSVRDVFWLWLTPFTAQLASGRMRKGTPRWMQIIQSNTGVHTTFDSKLWVALSSSPYTTFVVGPWDGTTTPMF